MFKLRLRKTFTTTKFEDCDKLDELGIKVEDKYHVNRRWRFYDFKIWVTKKQMEELKLMGFYIS